MNSAINFRLKKDIVMIKLMLVIQLEKEVQKNIRHLKYSYIMPHGNNKINKQQKRLYFLSR